MLGRPRLDPFSERLLAIHKKGKPASTGAVDDVLTEIAQEKARKAAAAAEAEAAPPATGPQIIDIVEELDPNDDPEFAEAMRLAVESQQQMDTGCASCAEGCPSPSLEDAMREIEALKKRLAELESRVLYGGAVPN
jgi:cell division septation protein DedD